ncbi:MAG: hypothetical protein KDA88_15475 [Planctomycetaceae bacterium]|nr:hypothetical protein [Planctomycetaceae bacterium]
MRLQLLVLSLLLTSGCCQMATLHTWHPAEIDVTGMNRITVLDFQGENGPAVATAISGRLWENEFYTMVDRSEIQPVVQLASAGTPRLEEIVEPARKAGIDAVILGEVVEYRCDDETFQSTDIELGSSQTKGHGFQQQSNGIGLSMNQTLVRQGTVTIAFRLVDVETGDMRASRKVSRHFEGKNINGTGSLPTQGEVLENLTDQCVDEIVTMLAPHEGVCQCKLARSQWFTKGSREVSQGVKLAKRGDWAEAERRWHAALEENPSNDAALFNLSLSAVNRQEFAEAEELAMQAVRIKHKKQYVAGLDEIRAHRSDFEKTEDQREARVVQASASVWQ